MIYDFKSSLGVLCGVWLRVEVCMEERRVEAETCSITSVIIWESKTWFGPGMVVERDVRR